MENKVSPFVWLQKENYSLLQPFKIDILFSVTSKLEIKKGVSLALTSLVFTFTTSKITTRVIRLFQSGDGVPIMFVTSVDKISHKWCVSFQESDIVYGHILRL